MSVRRHVFGTLGEDQRIVHKYDIHNTSGSLKVTVTDYGATLLSVQTPDRNGELEEITLNHYDDLHALVHSERKSYFGCIAGRFANRIAKGKFTLDGEDYQLAVNNGENHLHGGKEGFDTKIWESDILEDGRIGVRFTLRSPHMEEGYPGHLCVVVEYELASHDENELQLHIYANTSAPTIVNLTNHAYWNLSGDGKRNIYSHFLHLASHHVLPVDTTQIPTGELKYVVEQPLSDNSESGNHTLGNFDFVSEERPRKLNEALLKSIVLDEQDHEKGRPGLDHCFVVDGYEPAIEGLTPYAAVADVVANVAVGDGTHKASSPRNANNKRLLAVGTLLEPESGRVLILRSTQPGVQVYTANWLPLVPPSSDDVDTNDSDTSGSNTPTGSASTKDRLFRMHNAICLETQHFPDSPNHPHFPSTVIRPTAAGKDANDPTGDCNTSTVAVPSNAHHDFYELTVFQFRVLP